MTTTETETEEKEPINSSVDNLKGIENHKTAAEHHEKAAKYHTAAATHHKEGNHEKAAEYTVKANGHSWFAHKYEMEDVEHHALISCHNDLISHVLI
jgi:hypothetical protein